MKILDKKFTIIIIAFFIIICISIYFFTKEEYSENIISSSDFLVSTNSTETVPEISKIIVHIDGEILNSGIVSLPVGSRISDAINEAGGVTELADISKINLAYILEDGQKVCIPSIYDEEIDVYVTESAGEGVLEQKSRASGSLININTANLAELETLPGIGSATAQKIINHREEHGKFKSIEEIMDVAGIGEAKFNAIKDLIDI